MGFADRHAFAAALVPALDQVIQQPEQPRIADLPPEQPPQDRMVHAGKILPDVGLEDIAPASLPPKIRLIAPHRGQAPAAHKAGIGVGDVGAFKDRGQHPVEGVMDDTIPKRGGLDQSSLRIGERRA